MGKGMRGRLFRASLNAPLSCGIRSMALPCDIGRTKIVINYEIFVIYILVEFLDWTKFSYFQINHCNFQINY